MESEKNIVVKPCGIMIKITDCLNCAACPPICHSGALQLHALKLELNEALCDNCLLCIPACPVGAIKGVNEDYESDVSELHGQ